MSLLPLIMALSAVAISAASSIKPHFVFVLADDLGWNVRRWLHRLLCRLLARLLALRGLRFLALRGLRLILCLC